MSFSVLGSKVKNSCNNLLKHRKKIHICVILHYTNDKEHLHSFSSHCLIVFFNTIDMIQSNIFTITLPYHFRFLFFSNNFTSQMDNFLLNIVLVQVVKAGKYFNCDLLNIQKVYLRGNRKKKKV